MNSIRNHTSLGPLAVAAALLAAPGPSHADTLYVSTAFNNTIEMFDSATGADLGAFANTGLNCPYGLAFDSAGNLYAANIFANTIEKFTPGGAGAVFASGLGWPCGLAFDRTGNLYAANYGDDTIAKLTPEGVGSLIAAPELFYPAGLAFDAAGNLYVANCGGGTIVKFTPDGVEIEQIKLFARQRAHAPARGKSRRSLDEIISNQPVRAGNPSQRF